MNDDDMLLVVIVDYFYVFMMVGYFSWGNDILGLLKRFNFFVLIFRIFMCFNIRWFYFDRVGWYGDWRGWYVLYDFDLW